jgi:hypothetical protein
MGDKLDCFPSGRPIMRRLTASSEPATGDTRLRIGMTALSLDDKMEIKTAHGHPMPLKDVIILV